MSTVDELNDMLQLAELTRGAVVERKLTSLALVKIWTSNLLVDSQAH